ncbi:hypothetical protein NXY55_27275, partial [Aeromonas veronii]|nr:hypothetical protein [Aeromonas veronii]
YYPANGYQQAHYINTPTTEQQQRQTEEFQNVWKEVRKNLKPHYDHLAEFNVNRNLSQYIAMQLVMYTLIAQNQFSGSLDQKVNQTYQAFRRQANWVFGVLSPYRIPDRELERIFKAIIRLTYETIGFSPEKNWSEWEDLGGYLTSGPSVTVPGRNQLDVYVRGRNRVLYRRMWNGT